MLEEIRKPARRRSSTILTAPHSPPRWGPAMKKLESRWGSENLKRVLDAVEASKK